MGMRWHRDWSERGVGIRQGKHASKRLVLLAAASYGPPNMLSFGCRVFEDEFYPLHSCGDYWMVMFVLHLFLEGNCEGKQMGGDWC